MLPILEIILNLSQHIINNVDIPLGFARAKNNANSKDGKDGNNDNSGKDGNNNNAGKDGKAGTEGSDTLELTQWVVFKDLKQKKLFFRTYDNLTLRSILLKDIDFSENAPALKMPMVGSANVPVFVDVTKNFLLHSGIKNGNKK